MQTANMDSCSLRLDYEVSSDSCTYLVFSVKTLLKQFPFRPIPGKLPPPVWWEWLPRKSLGPLKNAFKKNDIFWSLARFDVKFCTAGASLEQSSWPLKWLHVRPWEMARCYAEKWKISWATSVTRHLGTSIKMLEKHWGFGFLFVQKCTPLTVLGMTCKDERWREFDYNSWSLIVQGLLTQNIFEVDTWLVRLCWFIDVSRVKTTNSILTLLLFYQMWVNGTLKSV